MSGNLNALQAPPIRPVAQDTSTGNFVPLQSTGGALVVTGGGGGGGGNVVVTSGTLTAITNTVAVAGTVTIANPGSVGSNVIVSSGTLTTISNPIALAAGSAAIGTVSVSGGSLTGVTLGAGTAQIGTVALAGGTIAATGTVAVNNFPTTQAVSGTVAIGVALPAGANNIGTVSLAGGTIAVTGTVSSLSTIQNAVTLASGVNNVGTVAIAGGALTVGGTTKVVSGSLYNLGGGTTYSNGVVIGSSASPGGTGLVSVTGVFRAGATSGLLQTLSLVSSDAQTTASMNGVVWTNGIPTSSTVTDHTALNVSAADNLKGPLVIPLTSAFALGTPTAFQALQQAVPIVAPTGTFDIAFVQTGTFASASTQDLSWFCSFLSD